MWMTSFWEDKVRAKCVRWREVWVKNLILWKISHYFIILLECRQLGFMWWEDMDWSTYTYSEVVSTFLHEWFWTNVVKNVNPDVKLELCNIEEDVYNKKMFQAAVGRLFYLSTKTHPDITLTAGSITHFSAGSTKKH